METFPAVTAARRSATVVTTARWPLAILMVVLLGIGSVSAPAAGAFCRDYRDYLHVAGGEQTWYPGGMRVRDDLAYVVDGHLRIMDITNSLQPVELGATGPAMRGIALAGDVAFSLWNPISQTVVLAAFDISDPLAPTMVPESGGPYFVGARAVAASGKYAFVVSYHTLTVVDATDPAQMTVVTDLTLPGFYALQIEVVDDLAYVANHESGLQIIDVADPTAPAIIGESIPPGGVNGFALRGSICFAVCGHEGLRIIDVSDPAAPVGIGSVGLPGDAANVGVEADLAYVVSDVGLLVVDVSDLAHPAHFETVFVLGQQQYLAVASPAVYVQSIFYTQTADGSFHVFDVENPLAIHGVSLEMYGIANDVAISGDHAYVAAQAGGLKVVDLSSPDAPSVVGSLDTPGDARGVAVAGQRAYVTEGPLMRTVDVTDPAAPVIAGTLDLPATPRDLEVAGELAYVAASEAGLLIADVTDDAAPVLLGSYDTAGVTYGVTLHDGLVYLADGQGGLVVVDGTDPTTPVPVGSVAPEWSWDEYRDVAIVGHRALVAGFYSGLQIIDVTDPTSPVIVARNLLFAGIQNIEVAGSIAYLTVTEIGVQLLDVTDPDQPLWLGTVRSDQFVGAVALGDEVACVAEGPHDLRVLPRHCDGIVSVFLDRLWTTTEGDVTVVRWRVNEACAAEDFRIEARSEAHSAPSVRYLDCVQESSLEFAAHDQAVDREPGAEIDYILWHRVGASDWQRLDSVTAVQPAPPALVGVVGSYPNPFNPRVRIELAVGRAQAVTVTVHDLRGRRVAELAAREFTAGRHFIEWDGRDTQGADAAAGVYLVHAVADGGRSSRKIVLAR